ncbi:MULTISPECIES: helix-turn-helix domain-containing protein [unclassified Streptomyces]|uniref:helix-turn-helix domain-containing protein n=1 Tax=unclassified Streptomyces TaxID=2593676 RepID=UPI0028C37D1F|nr:MULTISPECIES: helix-turn-helix domain-containing protein [unclassified Streptomyces]WNO75076.1 helix-turn-helix domain-containing protein [Streptomyces sp. AM8-1-1]
MRSVALALYDGAMLFEAAAACEVFGVDRELTDAWYDFRVCGPTEASLGSWLKLDTPYDYDALADADTVIVPACGDVEADPPADLVDAVRAAHERGARLVSLCTGAFVLAAAGVLDGRRATTHWEHTAALAARYPRIEVDPDVLYIDDRTVLTSAGKAAGMDLCLHIVTADHGAAVANALARRLVVPARRAGGQAQFVAVPAVADTGHAFADLLHWVSGRLDEPLTVPDLARQANMSTRNLTRRFTAATGTTPLRWLHTQRIHRAQELLETTDDSIELIAARTGMGTAATLRRHFHRALGVPPDIYRRTFRTHRTATPAT